MNNRCYAPIRKVNKRLTTYWAKAANGTALDKVTNLDVVLPSQWAPSAASSPELMLFTEVLVGAFTDLAHRRRGAIEENEAWLSESEEDSMAPISFGHLCGILHVDEGAVRNRLRRAIAAAKQPRGLV